MEDNVPSITELRLNTSACWWPNKITGRSVPVWDKIAEELRSAARMVLGQENKSLVEYENPMRLAMYATEMQTTFKSLADEGN